MAFFSDEPKKIEKIISKKILEEDDRLRTLLSILDHLPPDLVDWFKGILKSGDSTKSYVEVDLSFTINAIGILPGDMLVKKNRDPKIGDIVRIGIRNGDDYFTQHVKVMKINLRGGTIYVQNLLEKEIKGNTSVQNVIYVLEKIIKYGEPEWKKIVDILEISYDKDDIKRWVKNSIEFLEEEEEFYQREKYLKDLKKRLELLK